MRWRRWIAALVLPASVFLAYARGWNNDYVGLDDKAYISENPLLREPGGLRRIWLTDEAPQYYPLTFTSYWLEYRLWGPQPRGYYLANVALHAANALLVLALARALGLSFAAAWLAAALFALHPMQVQSVAWLAERKNVLSGLFALLMALLYLRHARAGARAEPDAHPVSSRSGDADAGSAGASPSRVGTSAGVAWYVLCLLAFAAALLSKTAVLTLPLSLLLAERWIVGNPWRAAILRTAPLLALSGLAAAVTVFVEHLSPVRWIEWPLRPLAAAGALWFYLGKLAWPATLLPIYPQWHVSAAGPLWWAALLGVILVAAAAPLWRRRSGAIGGWGLAHFAALLLPVLGLVPFGYLEVAPVADHFVYLAAIGPLAIAANAVARSAAARAPASRFAAPAVAAAALLACAVRSWQQVQVWRSERELFGYVLRHDPDSALANQRFGFFAFQEGRFEEAARYYAKVVAAQPNKATPRNDLGAALRNLGRIGEAAGHFQAAIALEPDNAMAHLNLAGVLAQRAQFDEAEREFRTGTALVPDHVLARLAFADFLASRERPAEAEEQYRAALRLDPDHADGCFQFAQALAKWGRTTEAEGLARRALQSARAAGQDALAREISRWLRQQRRPP